MLEFSLKADVMPLEMSLLALKVQEVVTHCHLIPSLFKKNKGPYFWKSIYCSADIWQETVTLV